MLPIGILKRQNNKSPGKSHKMMKKNPNTRSNICVLFFCSIAREVLLENKMHHYVFVLSRWQLCAKSKIK